MIRRPPRSTRTDTLFPYTTLFRSTQCGMALVSTSSICQGEQVALLWPTILDTATINFAYRPFKWANSAANNAGVWCTIVGLGAQGSQLRPLFSDDQDRKSTRLNSSH